jgi:hypothetical protein
VFGGLFLDGLWFPPAFGVSTGCAERGRAMEVGVGRIWRCCPCVGKSNSKLCSAYKNALKQIDEKIKIKIK